MTVEKENNPTKLDPVRVEHARRPDSALLMSARSSPGIVDHVILRDDSDAMAVEARLAERLRRAEQQRLVKRRRILAGIGAALIIVLLGIGIWLLWLRR